MLLARGVYASARALPRGVADAFGRAGSALRTAALVPVDAADVMKRTFRSSSGVGISGGSGVALWRTGSGSSVSSAVAGGSIAGFVSGVRVAGFVPAQPYRLLTSATGNEDGVAARTKEMEAAYIEVSKACGFTAAGDRKSWAPKDRKKCQWEADPDAKQWAEDLTSGFLKVRKLATDGKLVDDGKELSGDKVNPDPGEVAPIGAGVVAIGMRQYVDSKQRKAAVGNPHVFVRGEVVDATELAMAAVLKREMDGVGWEMEKVVLTGSPGAGKTFMACALAVAEALEAGEQVLRVSAKSNEVRLLRRNPFNDEMEAWRLTDRGAAMDWNRLPVARIKSVLAVYDPRELKEGTPVFDLDNVNCRLLMVPSDNPKYWGGTNFTGKSGDHALLYMDPPTEREAVAVTLQLWSEEESMPPPADGVRTVVPPAGRVEEIERRFDLVGPFPRYLATYTLFEERINDIYKKVVEFAVRTSAIGVRAAITHAEINTESGRVNVTRVVHSAAYADEPWLARRNFRREVMPLALYVDAGQNKVDMAAAAGVIGKSAWGERFKRNIALTALMLGAKGGASLGHDRKGKTPDKPTISKAGYPARVYYEEGDEDTLQLYPEKHDEVYAVEREPVLELKGNAKCTEADAFEAVRNLENDDKKKVVLWLPKSDVLAADFALSSTHLVNAKVGEKPKLKCSALLDLHWRVHGENSKAVMTLDVLLPASDNEWPGLKLIGSKAERDKVLGTDGNKGLFKLRAVAIPLGVMGRSFDLAVGGHLKHYGIVLDTLWRADEEAGADE